jgi:hypothetical protein
MRGGRATGSRTGGSTAAEHDGRLTLVKHSPRPARHLDGVTAVPEWTDPPWGGFPAIAEPTTAALYPLHLIAYAMTRDAPLRFFDVAQSRRSRSPP